MATHAKHAEEKENVLGRALGMTSAGIGVATAAVALGTVGMAMAAENADTTPVADDTQVVTAPETTTDETAAPESNDEVQPTVEEQNAADEQHAQEDEANADQKDTEAADVKQNEVDPAKDNMDKAADAVKDAQETADKADQNVKDAENAPSVIDEQNDKIQKALEDADKAKADVADADAAVKDAQDTADKSDADVDAAQKALDAAKAALGNNTDFSLKGYVEYLKQNAADEHEANHYNQLLKLIEQYEKAYPSADASDPRNASSNEMLNEALSLYQYLNLAYKLDSTTHKELKVDLEALIHEVYRVNASAKNNGTKSWNSSGEVEDLFNNAAGDAKDINKGIADDYYMKGGTDQYDNLLNNNAIAIAAGKYTDADGNEKVVTGVAYTTVTGTDAYSQLTVSDFVKSVQAYNKLVEDIKTAQANLAAAQDAQAKAQAALKAAQEKAEATKAEAAKTLDDADARIAAAREVIADQYELLSQKDLFKLEAAKAHRDLNIAIADYNQAENAYNAALAKYNGLLEEAANFRAHAAADRQAIADRNKAAEEEQNTDEETITNTDDAVVTDAEAVVADNGNVVAATETVYGSELANTGVAVEALAASSMVALMLGLGMAETKRRKRI
ncbi:prolipoprotein diacylglyceryl transferase [Alloscardovia criceti]|uniref:hypothetical protein n=1 Tax=Alloscardovia criceti TaxID=356828 RepID=UPI0003785F1D|nr:hypothetical protein [Alloscardovia criceti]